MEMNYIIHTDSYGLARVRENAYTVINR